MSNSDNNNEERNYKPYSKYRERDDDGFKFKFNWNLSPKIAMPYFVILMIFILSLYLVFLLFDGVIMPSIVHSKELIKVPNLTGKNLDEGIAVIASKKMAYKISHEIYSEEFPSRTIVQQVPYPDSEVKEGRTIYLTVSKGKETVSVPYLISLTISQARIELMKRGLELGEINYDFSETIGKDTIMSQSIFASKYVPYGSVIDITVSQGSNAIIEIPNLVGLWLEEVHYVITENGFELGNITYQSSETFTPNTVISQFPSQGELHPKGTRIDVTVSK